MSLTKIVTISGKPGLYEIIAQSKGGFITTSLFDNKKTPVRSSQNVSVLSEIGIYTYDEEEALGQVFLNIHEKEEGKETINHKSSNEELNGFFREILPEYDEERVYVSNIKKIVQWYNLLVKFDFDFNSIKEDLEKLDEAQQQASE